PRRQALNAARDVFGMRPLCWHRSDRLLAIASEPKAILALPEVPREIDIGRTADFLIPELEGIDKTSTFWCGIERLPPAHVLVADARGTRIERYWSPEEVAELKLASSADYDEAFLDLLAQSIRARLRSVGPVAAMLSGGMDSGSIVAVASKLLREADQPPLVTFSAVGPDPATCTETRLARATAAHCGTDAHFINYDDLGDLMPELAHAMAASSEPFDYNMSLPCSVFMSAKRKGHKVVLSGAAGDNVLDAGLYVPRLLLSGRWRQLVRVGAGLVRFWGAGPARSLLLDQLSPALVPPPVFRRLRAWQFHRWTRSAIARGAITAERARLAHLPERYRTLHARFPIGVRHPYALERWQWIDLPYLVIGLERYDRVAGAQGIELREPFLDRRLVQFCLSLPGEQLLGNGWPKMILRRATGGLMPETVRWSAGKQHLGWKFTSAVLGSEAGNKALCGHAPVRQPAVENNCDLSGSAYHEPPGRPGFLREWLRRHRSSS
ncbi:MAG: asparagine synthetase B, partial [Hyphomicrobiaceae bacterium]